MSRQRLWPMIPDRSLASTLRPYCGCSTASYCDGSMEDQGGIQRGFMLAFLCKISAMCPPPLKTVTRKALVSNCRASRFWNFMVFGLKPWSGDRFLNDRAIYLV